MVNWEQGKYVFIGLYVLKINFAKIIYY